jgi:nucleoside-diphosphate-sugar epimerase
MLTETSTSCLRFSNIYGPHPKPSSLLADLLSQMPPGSSQKKSEVYVRDVMPVRDYLYITDCVSAVDSLLRTRLRKGGHCFNVSSGRGVSVKSFAQILYRAAHCNVVIRENVEGDRPKASRIVLDNKSFVDATGWSPCYTLQMGLKETLLKMTLQG